MEDFVFRPHCGFSVAKGNEEGCVGGDGGDRAYWGVHVRAALRMWNLYVHLVERGREWSAGFLPPCPLPSFSLFFLFFFFSLFLDIWPYFVDLAVLDLTM